MSEPINERSLSDKTGHRDVFMFSLQSVEDRNPPVAAFWLPSPEEKNSLKKMNVLRKNLAIVGFIEYRSKIECVDGWFAEGDPRAEEYDIVIEKAGEQIRVRETYERKGAFLVNCRKGLRSEALQSLALLFNSKGNIVGFDWYDVFNSMPRVVDYYFCEIAGDACLDGMRSAVEPDLEYIREHPEEDWVTWVQLEGDHSVMPDWELLLEVRDKLNTLTDGLLEFACSVPVIENRKSLAAAFWLPAPEENTGPEN